MSNSLASERQMIASYGRKLIDHSLTKGTSGNLSIFNRDQGLIAISPSGLDFHQTAQKDVVVLDLSGNIVDGERKPSSEWPLHKMVYEQRLDVSAVVHAHSTFSTVLSCLGWEMPALHYMIAIAGPSVRCASYATFGTEELGTNAVSAMAQRNAVFLANHGMLAAASDLAQAFHIAEEIEFCAELYWRCKCVGVPKILKDSEMTRIKDLVHSYGQGKNAAAKTPTKKNPS